MWLSSQDVCFPFVSQQRNSFLVPCFCIDAFLWECKIFSKRANKNATQYVYLVVRRTRKDKADTPADV